MSSKMKCSELRDMIKYHFAKQGKRMSNISKATKPKLLQIVEQYNICSIEYKKNLQVDAEEELIEKQKRGMHPNTHWDMITYVNTRDADSAIAQSYDFTLPVGYDVFFWNITECGFQTSTNRRSAEPRIQISEDNGSSFLSSGYNGQRTSGSQQSTTLSNKTFEISSIELLRSMFLILFHTSLFFLCFSLSG